MTVMAEVQNAVAVLETPHCGGTTVTAAESWVPPPTGLLPKKWSLGHESLIATDSWQDDFDDQEEEAVCDGGTTNKYHLAVCQSQTS